MSIRKVTHFRRKSRLLETCFLILSLHQLRGMYLPCTCPVRMSPGFNCSGKCAGNIAPFCRLRKFRYSPSVDKQRPCTASMSRSTSTQILGRSPPTILLYGHSAKRDRSPYNLFTWEYFCIRFVYTYVSYAACMYVYVCTCAHVAFLCRKIE